MQRILSEFRPTPPQRAFLNSKATVRGYGGAMAGGKTRCLMEAVLDAAIKYPGIQILVARARHTTIIETTRRTMMKEVLGPCPELVERSKMSQGEDWLEIYSQEPGVTSRVNFIGLDDPVKWYSSEIGMLVFDEAHEIREEDAVQLMTRLRQKGMPHKTLIAFNPSSPGHWLQEWFILGSAQKEHGFYKEKLTVREAESPLGSAEFVFANAYDNPHLPQDYIERSLGSLPALLKRRLLQGEWVLTDGSLFFDGEALVEYQRELQAPWKTGVTAGDPTGGDPQNPIRVKLEQNGALAVWKAPVRAKAGKPAHRYVVAVDVSSGGAADYTGIQVIDVEDFEQVAELQVKLDPDLAAVEAYRLACIYNGALLVPEVTGGIGLTIVRVAQRLNLQYKGNPKDKPVIYQRIVGAHEKLGRDFTEKLGWDTNVRTRALMLDTLEEVIRQRSLKINGVRTHTELTHFARDDKGRPAALSGRHDDLTLSLAIGVFIAVSLPKQLRRMRPEPHKALVGATGY